ncbi:MAG: glycosyltransferase family 2 protein [Planctomycetota bacterium]|nr:MAG: glycosyltransferase family 2 protein [Planctomycetota bacterium]
MKEKLTVIIPCKNERLNIRPCVLSAKLVADEVLVADSGSTDGSLDIVREIGGCRIVEREYINSGNFKNWAIPQATHPWVLIVDSDERVSDGLAREINALLAEGPTRDGYHIYRENYFLGHHIRHAGWGADKVLRLFRRDLGRYEGESDHAEVHVRDGNVGYLRHRLLHYTYWSYDQYFRKLHRYTVQGAQNKYAAGKRASFWQMLLAPPLRFLHCYIFRLGFLDGLAGLQISALTGMSSFIKQLRLWEMEHRLDQPDPEAEHAADQSRHAA